MFSLLRQRDFGLLWLAGLISFAGTAAISIALPLHVYQLTDSTLATAVSLFARFLPRVVLGSVAGVFVDRWDRKRTMVIADIARAMFLLPFLIAPDELVVIYAISAALGTIGLFFAPAEGALLPKLVGAEHLVAANALNAVNNNFGLLIGPAMGAVLYAKFGIGGTALADAATFALSATLISLIASDGRPERLDDSASGTAAWARVVQDWRAGLSVVRRERSLRVLFASELLANVAEGVFLTLGLAPLVLDVLGGTSAQVGWFATVQGVGGLIAGVIVVRIGHRMTKRWLYGGGEAALGLADLAAANAARIASPGNPAVGVAMGWMVVAGFPAVTAGSGRQAIVQTYTTDAYRGRVFGALSSVSSVALIVGFAVGGVLGDAISLVAVLSAGALLRVLGGIVALVFLPRHEHNHSSLNTNISSQEPELRQPAT